MGYCSRVRRYNGHNIVRARSFILVCCHAHRTPRSKNPQKLSAISRKSRSGSTACACSHKSQLYLSSLIWRKRASKIVAKVPESLWLVSSHFMSAFLSHLLRQAPQSLQRRLLNDNNGTSTVPHPSSFLSHIGTMAGNTININIYCEADRTSVISLHKTNCNWLLYLLLSSSWFVGLIRTKN